jgi:CheY-like chemotaxis protein
MKPVKIDPGQFEQVIVNLAVNASHAMPDGGKFVIQTQCNEAAAGRLDVVLSVKDTGIGMSDEVKTRIFEPFFTTKAKGQGTGLGLATVYGIVSQSGGRIEVESHLGGGSTFIIYLPSVNEPAMALERNEANTTGARGSETVLVADDDPSLRGFMSRILKEHGYNVLEASDGEEAALTAAKHVPQKLHLLLSDMVMPKMGGKEAAKKLRAIYPDIRIIYTSGYLGATERLAHLDSCEAFLQKPFTPGELAQKVRDVLDKMV